MPTMKTEAPVQRDQVQRQHDPLVGAWIAGRFLVERQLAEGGMGRVYLARQQALDRPVAIKVLHVDDPEQERQYQRRFELEAAVLGRLKHPNTVRVFDYGLHEGRPYIVMEYIEGPTLAERMGSPMDPLAAIRLVRQLAAAVDEAHDYGVVHRDLKPMNVLLTRTNEGEQAKVLDFGVASLANTIDSGPGGTVLGTATYMAPEQVQGRAVDHRADLYALGVILYGLLTGAKPFDVDSTREMLHAHLTQAPVAFAERGVKLPRVLEWTVRACLRKAPEERIASARDLVAALNHCELALRSGRYDVLPLLEQGRVVLPQSVVQRDGGFAGPSPQADRSTQLFWAGVGVAAVAALLGFALVRPVAMPRSVVVPVPVIAEPDPDTLGEPFLEPERRVEAALPAPAPAQPPPGAQPGQRRRAPARDDLLDPFADRR